MSEAAAIAAIQAIWAANWGRSEPVVWHQNTNDTVPAAGTHAHWLQIAVEFADEGVVAFGGGRFDNERRLRGSVVLRGFAKRGVGEATLVAMLDAAMAAFRGQRTGGVSFVGESVIQEPGASADGIWWCRSRIVVFEYRFRG